MTSFTDFNLNTRLLDSLQQMGYQEPTPIQEQAIPIALQGRDVMGSAQTGTGKTAAFAIPMIESLFNSQDSTALVLTPTRELGRQVIELVKQLLGKKHPIKTAFLIGGEPMGKQLAQLRHRPRIVVGTPGRVFDHLERGRLNLNECQFLVLDETDRMLDMGFSIQLDRIIKFIPQKPQTLMFSATLPKNIIKLSNTYLENPKRVAVGSLTSPVEKIKQEVIKINEDKKYYELARQLKRRDGTIIVFAKTKHGTEKLAKRLNNDGVHADAIHGDLKQNRRDKVLKQFRNEKFRVLVATDVASRGLDIPHIKHVINYDIPQVPEDYIHRIGRTARAGKEGEALCLVTPQDGRKWHAIECLMNPELASKAKPRNNKPKRHRRRPQQRRARAKSA